MNEDTEDKYLIKAREKITKFKEQIKTCDDINRQIQFFKEHFAFRLKQIEARYNLNEEPNYLLLAELLDAIAFLSAKHSELNTDELSLANALHFNELGEKIFRCLHGTKYQNHRDAEMIGAFTMGLVVHGSSVNKATDLMSMWCGVSRNTITNHYNLFLAHSLFSDDYENRKNILIDNYAYEIASLIVKNSNKEFPIDSTNSSLKTKEAFDDLVKNVKARFRQLDNGRMKPSVPFEIDISWEEYDEIVKKILK